MEERVDRICAFIRQKVEKAGADGIVVGVSGGVDSALVAALCAKAVGKENVYGLILPEKATTPQDAVSDAREVASLFCGKENVIDFTGVLKAFAEAMPDFAEGAMIPNGNLRARIRMCILYYYANKVGLLVAGTGDKSEISLGYFTKFGDGGCDFLPIADLYKTEVREMARFLEVPAQVAEKKSSPGLWVGHTAEGELGIGYEEIDALLKAVDAGEPLLEAAERLGMKKELAQKLEKMNEASAHKRAMPDICWL
ncbi:putative NH(3)-dependent NAD(+) synthetase [uncultured archaeon]|nr:putative NH(3)-dependent NAD(+) synthetase [uncultured archaeon]